MITLKIKGIEQPFEVSPSNSYQLVIENQKEFFNISKRIMSFEVDDVILYDSKLFDCKKSILVISNLFDLNPNNKKILNANYQYVASLTRNSKLYDQLIEINSMILSILDEISTNFNNQMYYNDQITINDLLEAYDFKFEFEDSTFIQAFVTYIKALTLAINYKVVITFNIQDFLNEEDFQLLMKELGYLGLTLINICSKKSELPYKKTIIIDKDLCEI